MTRHLLDIAETLPAFQGGFLRTLQSIRQRQRKAAEQMYVATRPPSGSDVVYSGFRLFELFPVEESYTLSNGLRKLFPAKQYGPDQVDEFNSSLTEMFTGGWSNIGVLVRDSKSVWGLQKRVLPDLPEEVRSIEISTHKILPSAVVVAFDVTLTHTATKQLKALHDQRYLSEVRFHNFMPWRKYGWSRSESPTEWSMRGAILESELHSRIGRILTSYLSGFFHRSIPGRFNLPVIDNFMVSGISAGDLVKLPKPFAPWLESIVSTPTVWSLDSYVGENIVFTWKDTRRGTSIPYRLIEIYPEFTEDQGAQSFARQEKLDALLPYLCFIEAISSVQSKLESLRLHVYQALAQTRLIRKSLKKEIKLNDQVQKEAMFISRLSLELGDAKPWIKHEAKVLHDLFRPYIESGQDKLSLVTMLENVLDFRLDRARKHLEFVAKMFAEYISRRNLKVMYHLQQLVFILAVVATLAALLGVIGNWEQLKRILQIMWNH